MQKNRAILIVFDAEGITGISQWKDVVADFSSARPSEKLKKAMGEDISAVLEGAYGAGIKRAYVLDWHYSGNNIRKGDLKIPKGMKVILKTETPEILKEYSSRSSFAALIGFHGKTDSNDGLPPWFEDEFESGKKKGVAHVFAFTIDKMLLNGVSRGEAVIYAHVLKELNTPLIFCSGSKAATDELTQFAPEVVAVPTRDGNELFDANDVRSKIKYGVKLAIKKADEGGFTGKDYSKFNYKSFTMVFNMSNDKRYAEQVHKEFAAFLQTIPKKYLLIKKNRISFNIKGQQPYFKIYSLIIKSVNSIFE
ncbi:MAG: M55 family metallopeptidase [Candidatus Aenigmarchaeota archaeon]|nr:M55 family metallopeptidase [Candidatus Aenigmarchaeota archaeon]